MSSLPATSPLLFTGSPCNALLFNKKIGLKRIQHARTKGKTPKLSRNWCDDSLSVSSTWRLFREFVSSGKKLVNRPVLFEPSRNTGTKVPDKSIDSHHAAEQASIIDDDVQHNAFTLQQITLLAWIERYGQLCGCAPTVEQLLWQSPFQDSVTLRQDLASLLVGGWLALPFEQEATRELLTETCEEMSLTSIGGVSEGQWPAMGVLCRLWSVPIMQLTGMYIMGASSAYRTLRTQGQIKIPQGLFYRTPDFGIVVEDTSLVSAEIFPGDLVLFKRQKVPTVGQIALNRFSGQLNLGRFGGERDGQYVVHAERPGVEPSRVPVAKYASEGVLVGVVPQGNG